MPMSTPRQSSHQPIAVGMHRLHGTIPSPSSRCRLQPRRQTRWIAIRNGIRWTFPQAHSSAYGHERSTFSSTGVVLQKYICCDGGVLLELSRRLHSMPIDIIPRMTQSPRDELYLLVSRDRIPEWPSQTRYIKRQSQISLSDLSSVDDASSKYPPHQD